MISFPGWPWPPAIRVFRVKLTSRQTLVAVLGADRVDDLVNTLPALGLKVSPYGNVVRAVKACAGNSALCPRPMGEALDLGMEIQEKYLGVEVPKDFKIAVAGCVKTIFRLINKS